MPPKTTVGAARPRLLADFVTLQGVAGMNADADHVAGGNSLGIQGSRVSSVMIGSPYCRCRRREHVQPSGRYHPNAELRALGLMR
jgi:hypothetical protein